MQGEKKNKAKYIESVQLYAGWMLARGESKFIRYHGGLAAIQLVDKLKNLKDINEHEVTFAWGDFYETIPLEKFISTLQKDIDDADQLLGVCRYLKTKLTKRFRNWRVLPELFEAEPASPRVLIKRFRKELEASKFKFDYKGIVLEGNQPSIREITIVTKFDCQKTDLSLE